MKARIVLCIRAVVAGLGIDDQPMGRHYVHYLRREINAQAPTSDDFLWYAQEQSPEAGFQRPMYHITRSQSGPSTRIQSGDTIWLFSCLYTPWENFPPSLDAMLHLEAIHQLPDGRTQFIAGDNSRWFPLADAQTLLWQLQSVNAAGIVKPLIADKEQPVGRYMRRIRQLDSGVPLLSWSSQLQAMPFHFISYRIKDGTRYACRKAMQLIQEGKLVFWDRYCLPRRLVERREQVDDNALDQYLLDTLSRASKVWGIETEAYFEANCYAQKEATKAKALGIYETVNV